MRILSLTAGAAQMYCGSCLRDNALARELIALGHDVVLVPVYTPTKVDGQNVSSSQVLFGGISVYLQQHSSFFRHTPRFLDRLLDSRWALGLAARRSISVQPKLLGEMTVAMLEGAGGPLAKEFAKLEYWLSHEQSPDIVNLPNAMLIAMAPSIKHVFRGPVVCTMQGEDLFLDQLVEPYRSHALSLIRRQVKHVDAFVAVSEAYAGVMADYLAIPRERIHVVPLGIDVPSRAGQRAGTTSPFTVGYLARIAPEKGLHLLCEAWREFRVIEKGPARLRAAGYLAPEFHSYLETVQDRLRTWGLSDDFSYGGELSREEKLDFFASLDVFSVPAAYDDPKGLYVLEAMAAGVPVVEPRRGALREYVEAAGSGLLVPPDDPRALAEAWLRLKNDPALRADLGARGREAATGRYSVRAMAQRALAVYEQLLSPAQAAA